MMVDKFLALVEVDEDHARLVALLLEQSVRLLHVEGLAVPIENLLNPVNVDLESVVTQLVHLGRRVAVRTLEFTQSLLVLPRVPHDRFWNFPRVRHAVLLSVDQCDFFPQEISDNHYFPAARGIKVMNRRRARKLGGPLQIGHGLHDPSTSPELSLAVFCLLRYVAELISSEAAEIDLVVFL